MSLTQGSKMEELLTKMSDLLQQHDEQITELKSQQDDERVMILETKVEVLEADLREARVKNETLIEMIELMRSGQLCCDTKAEAKPDPAPKLVARPAKTRSLSDDSSWVGNRGNMIIGP